MNGTKKIEELASLKIPRALHHRVKVEAVKQNLKFKDVSVAAFLLWLREMRAEK